MAFHKTLKNDTFSTLRGRIFLKFILLVSNLPFIKKLSFHKPLKNYIFSTFRGRIFKKYFCYSL